MSSELAICRLILSSRNTYKIEKKPAKQCLILSDSGKDILINTSKEFNPKDNYVLIDTNKKHIVENYGIVGNELDDINIFHHLHTYFWSSNNKLYKYLKDWNTEYDVCDSRELYVRQVITIDPIGSIDLDDGFTLNFNEEIELDIHISDPMSYFDLAKQDSWTILQEMINRISTCYIPLNEKIKHLLPEINNKEKNLLLLSTLIGDNKRAISFCFKINIITNTVNFSIKKTILKTITNTTYDEYDKKINEDIDYKNKLIILGKFMINHMNCTIDVSDFLICNNISHKLIEIFMIWTNFYAGNFLYKEKNIMIVRTQEKIIDNEQIIPEYVKPFLNFGAKYQFVNTKTDTEYTHHSLGISNYCHVTSPMRRLIDMINHLLIHDIDKKKEFYNELVKLFDIEKINSKLKNYKKLSSAFEIIKYIKTNNKFKACVFNIKKNKALLVLYDESTKFKKIVKVEIPLEYFDKFKQYDELTIELFFDSYKFKSKTLPFSIKII